MYLINNVAHNSSHCGICREIFSKLKLIKNYLRATSGQSRVMYLARFCIESKLEQELEYDDIIKPF